MSIDFEERLRADMGHVEVHPRPGLVREAHRRYRQGRRRTALAVAATGTAAAVAGATAGFALTAGSPGTAPIQTTAYVVSRVSGALASTDTIGYSTSRISGLRGWAPEMTGRTDIWQFGGRSRDLIDTASGQTVTDIMRRAEGRSLVLTIIDYQNRTWNSTTIPPHEQLTPIEGNSLCSGRASGSVQTLYGEEGKSAADWRHIIETGLKCGAFTVAGRQRVDGVDAIKLTGHKTIPDSTIWVDPRSYLPVRLVSHGQTAGNVAPIAITLTVDFRWLPPTRANLAKLTAPIPAGFQKVTYPE